METIVAGSVSWHLAEISSVQEFLDRFDVAIQGSAKEGCELVVLPEFFSLELLHMHNGFSAGDVSIILSEYFDLICDTAQKLANETKMTLVAGSSIRRCSEHFFNTAITVFPNEPPIFTDKMNLTQYEIDPMCLSQGKDWAQPISRNLGVMVCYDSEFPEATRALSEAGALIHAVPAYTEGEHGTTRIETCCSANAIQNQVFVVQSSLVGTVGEKRMFDATGRSAIYAPAIEPFPSDGILASDSKFCFAELDLQVLLNARNQGDVRNWNDRNTCDWCITEV